MTKRRDPSAESVRFAWPALGDDEIEEVREVLLSGDVKTGRKVAEFEEQLATVCAVADAVTVSSGTTALHLAVLALGLEPEDEVLVPAYAFPATAMAVARAGLRVRLVEVERETMNIDPAKVRVGPRTKAVVVVHLFGRPASADEFPSELAVVEDAAGALGGRRQGRACGGLGRVGLLSFDSRRIVTTDHGGAVTTNDHDLANRIRKLRHHGRLNSPGGALLSPGFDYRLPNMLCAVGAPQLRRLDALLGERERLAERYRERLAALPVDLPTAAAGDRHGWQSYVIQVDRRDSVFVSLRRDGIEAQIGTFALNRLTAFRDQGPFPEAERAFKRALALPFDLRLTDSELDWIAERVGAALQRRRLRPEAPR